jgi:hypothetical protein
MTPAPAWLPAMIVTDGEWESVLVRLYAVFVRDIKQGNLVLNDRAVWWDRRVLPDSKYEEGFWHLITRDERPKRDRLFDPRRAERLPWFAPTIRNAGDVEVRVWDYEEGRGAVRTYVWLCRFDYLLIFEKKTLKGKKRVIAFLVTAFYVDGEKSRETLERKYRRRCP